MQMDRSVSNLWIWGLAAVVALILLIGRVAGPGSPAVEPPALVETPDAAPVEVEPIGDEPDSYPVLSEPRETGLQDAFDQEQAAGESGSAL